LNVRNLRGDYPLPISYWYKGIAALYPHLYGLGTPLTAARRMHVRSLSVMNQSGALTVQRPVDLFQAASRSRRDHVTPHAVQPTNTVHHEKTSATTSIFFDRATIGQTAGGTRGFKVTVDVRYSLTTYLPLISLLL